jgi:DNA-directed RNA polymerase specialized sigma24 family protein
MLLGEGYVVTELEAIDRLKHGDIGGLEAIVKTYQLRATRAAYLVVGDWQTAEDVVQAAFLQVYERIDQFDASRPFAPWFVVLAQCLEQGLCRRQAAQMGRCARAVD